MSIRSQMLCCRMNTNTVSNNDFIKKFQIDIIFIYKKCSKCPPSFFTYVRTRYIIHKRKIWSDIKIKSISNLFVILNFETYSCCINLCKLLIFNILLESTEYELLYSEETPRLLKSHNEGGREGEKGRVAWTIYSNPNKDEAQWVTCLASWYDGVR